MEKGLKLYEEFIDGLVKQHKSVQAAWVKGGNFPDVEKNKAINDLLQKLSDDEKETLAGTFQEVFDSGIHDTLAYLDEKIHCDGLQITENGVPYITGEFDSMHYDFVCRKEGDEWPEV